MDLVTYLIKYLAKFCVCSNHRTRSKIKIYELWLKWAQTKKFERLILELQHTCAFPAVAHLFINKSHDQKTLCDLKRIFI